MQLTEFFIETYELKIKSKFSANDIKFSQLEPLSY